MVARFSNQAFDWIYNDADHRFRLVCDDLDAWWPKLKPGGLFAGHDYLDSADEPMPNRHPRPLIGEPDNIEALPFGAKSAVDQFAGRHELHVFCSTGPPDERNSPSWFCWKE